MKSSFITSTICGIKLDSKVSSLCPLFKQQQQNGKSGDRHSPDFGGECRPLTYNSTGCPTNDVLELFSFLPFLRNLRLISSRRRVEYMPNFTFQVGKPGRTLHQVRDTLETLTLFIAVLVVCTASRVGNSFASKAMSYLVGQRLAPQRRLRAVTQPTTSSKAGRSYHPLLCIRMHT